MVWVVYNFVFAIGYLLVLPRFLLRMKKRGGYSKHFLQRLGIYRGDILSELREKPGRIWVHAVSVGEYYVARKFMEQMRKARPGTTFVLSVTTSTAHAIAGKQLPKDDMLIYFPVDFPFVLRRVLKILRPRALILLEGEIWPNLIRMSRHRGIPVFVINGRMSARSFKGYRRLKFFTSRLFPMVEMFCVQTDADRERLLMLGAVNASVRVLGSAKYDVAETNPEAEATAVAVLRAAGIAEGELVLLGGSTWPGEEKALAELYLKMRQAKLPCALVIVPRHVERTAEILEELESLNVRVLLRSTIDLSRPPPVDINDPFVFLVNTTGELQAFYSAADLIFVGKSLMSTGGQNIIEPALYGKPIVVGPHMENFPVVIQEFLSAQAVVQVPSVAALEAEVFNLARDSERRGVLSKNSRQLVEKSRGALVKTAEMIVEHLGAA